MGAHMDATAPLASKEGAYKAKKQAAIKAAADAVGIQKAAMLRAADLAKQAAAAQKVVKKDVIIAKKKHALQRKAIAASKKSDHAFRLHVKFTKKHAATTILHRTWTKKSEEAAKKVTLSKEVAVNAMETAQCVIKDKRSGCTKWKKTGHCKTASFKAWMVTHSQSRAASAAQTCTSSPWASSRSRMRRRPSVTRRPASMRARSSIRS